MAEFPSLPLWTDAYLGDTTHLNTTEHGAYLLLLIVAWRTDKTRLPDDDRLLARYARCSAREWKRLRPVLEPFFEINDGFWTQKRLTDEKNIVQARRDSAIANGRLSALKRKGRHSTKRSTEREQSDQRNVNETPTPTTHNPQPIPTEGKEEDREPPTNGSRARTREGPDGGGSPTIDLITAVTELGRAAGVDTSGAFPARRKEAAEFFDHWTAEGFSLGDMTAIIAETRETSRSRITSVNYFNEAMARAVAQREHPHVSNGKQRAERPDPALALWRQAQRELAEEESISEDQGDHIPPLPQIPPKRPH